MRDDLSCANSRLFRATLYANTFVSAFLRSHFVLYWSTERAVPTARPGADFATLNAWIYETVFATPSADPWLGLRARNDFTGLAGDGVVMP